MQFTQVQSNLNDLVYEYQPPAYHEYDDGEEMDDDDSDY